MALTDYSIDTSGSPQDVQRKQALADALMKQGMDSTPAAGGKNGGWVTALNRGLAGALGGYQRGAAANEEQQGRTHAQQLAAGLLGPDGKVNQQAYIQASSDPWVQPQQLNAVGKVADWQTASERAAVSDKHQKFMEGLALRTANRADDPTPAGFMKGPDGSYVPLPGGPQDPAYQGRLAEEKARAAANVPTVIGANSAVVIPNKASEGALFTNKPSGDALLDSDTIDALAKQARAGDTSVFQNLGRGAQGAENIVKLRKEIARQNNEDGVSGAEQALRNAEMAGVKAGQRTIGTKGANIEMAATEFNQVLPVVQAASQAVKRTDYPDLNKIIMAGESKTGDPNVVKFGGGVNTLVNLYARAISPTGNPTVSDKEHAREILSASWSSGQFDAAVGMMQQEIKAALSSPEKVRDEMRSRFLKGQGAAPVGYPAPGGPEAQKGGDLLGHAREAIAKGAPREKVIERLRQNGIDPSGL